MLITIALIVGILAWPEMTFCVFLFTQGYYIAGVIALLTTFGSGSKWVTKQVSGK